MKEELLKDILEITKMQKEALEKEDIEAFEAFLVQKQSKIDALEELHRLHPKTKEEKHEDLLKVIISLDQQNKVEFERQLEEVKANLKKTRDQMSHLRQRQYVNHVYTNPYDVSSEEGIFYDKR